MSDPQSQTLKTPGVINKIRNNTRLWIATILFSNSPRINKFLSRLDITANNSQENEGEQSSNNNHSYQQEGEDRRYDDNGEGDQQTKLQERVHVQGEHGVHLLLIFGEAVENAACWRRVKETRGTGDNLRKEKISCSVCSYSTLLWLLPGLKEVITFKHQTHYKIS